MVEIPEAIGSGVTTMIAGGTGPAEGTKATTVTPGSWYLARRRHGHLPRDPVRGV